MRNAFLTAIAVSVLVLPGSAANAQAPSSGAVKHVWCVGNQGPDRYHSKIGEVRDFDSFKTSQAFDAVLNRMGVKVVRVICYREPTSAQINNFKNWSLTAKTPEPLFWHDVDWTPR